MTQRIEWDEVWMHVARTMARRSACTVFQAGTVIVSSENRLIATGYNGPPAGMNRTCDGSCPRAQGTVRANSYGYGCISVHSEANALMFCDRNQRRKGTLYINTVPCADCTKLIANSGLHRVVMIDDGIGHRPFHESQEFLYASGLTVGVYDHNYGT